MVSATVFVVRVLVGCVMLFMTWFVFDTIHDRNTEIIVSSIGLLYSFIFMISRRLQYFGLTVFSIFGRTTSYLQRVPYDQVLRDEVGASAGDHHLYLNAVFSALIEVLCLFRLFTSLLGRGWNILSDPIGSLPVIQSLLHSARF